MNISINNTALLLKDNRLTFEGIVAAGKVSVGIFIIDVATQDVKIIFASDRLHKYYLSAYTAISMTPQKAFSRAIKLSRRTA